MVEHEWLDGGDLYSSWRGYAAWGRFGMGIYYLYGLHSNLRLMLLEWLPSTRLFRDRIGWL